MRHYFTFEEEKINNSFPVFYPNNFFSKEYEHNNQFYNENEYFQYVINFINENNDCSTESEINYNDSKDEYLDLNNSKIDRVEFPFESSKILFEIKKRKRPGAKIKKESKNNKKVYVHTRNKLDNIATKIQVSYFNFL